MVGTGSILYSCFGSTSGEWYRYHHLFSEFLQNKLNRVSSENLDQFNKLDQETQEAIIQAAKDVEAEIWENVPEFDKDMEAIVNENGITTVPPSEELLSDLQQVTEEIRQNWLDTAPAEAREIIEKYNKAVGRE